MSRNRKILTLETVACKCFYQANCHDKLDSISESSSILSWLQNWKEKTLMPETSSDKNHNFSAKGDSSLFPKVPNQLIFKCYESTTNDRLFSTLHSHSRSNYSKFNFFNAQMINEHLKLYSKFNKEKQSPSR